MSEGDICKALTLRNPSASEFLPFFIVFILSIAFTSLNFANARESSFKIEETLSAAFKKRSLY